MLLIDLQQMDAHLQHMARERRQIEEILSNVRMLADSLDGDQRMAFDKIRRQLEGMDQCMALCYDALASYMTDFMIYREKNAGQLSDMLEAAQRLFE